MNTATKYEIKTAWRTLAKDVFQLTRETINDPATYRLTVAPVDTNNPGAGTKEIGFCLVDFLGIPYSIIATGSTTIDVQDDFRTGFCPTCGQFAIVYQSVFNGRSLFLSPENFQHLHPMALNNSHKYDISLLWANDPNTKKIPFISQLVPTIANYQDDQVDPEDAGKTVNYSDDFGENPSVRLIVTVDSATRYQRQQMPQFNYVDGLIDSVYFNLGEEVTGYILISKS